MGLYNKLLNDWKFNKFSPSNIITTNDRDKSLDIVKKFCEDNLFSKNSVDINNNPDYLFIQKEIINNKQQKYININQIRLVIDFFSKTAWQENRVAIINESESLNENASNALLKLLEDSPLNSYIFLITNNISSIIPTIKSRCRIINDDEKPSDDIISYNYLNILLDYKDQEIDKFLKIFDQNNNLDLWKLFIKEIIFALKNVIISITNCNIILSEEEKKLAGIINSNNIETILTIVDKVNYYSSLSIKYDLSKKHIFYLLAEIIGNES